MPTGTRHAVFETALGPCGIAWTEAGISRVALPEESARQLEHGLPGVAGDPPPAVREVMHGIVRLLAGQPETFAVLPLDTAGVADFNQRVYQITRSIPPGQTLCYGDVAARLGRPGAARAVGRALGENPWPIVVPCHRVVAADGSMHGFSAPGGLATKRRMLQLEGALAPDEPTLF